MFRTYIRSAWRSINRNRLFSFINIFGLALSMSICLIILYHFRVQLSYDNFHHDSSKLARIITEIHNADGREYRIASTPLPLAKKLKEEFPGIAEVTTIYPVASQLKGAKKHINVRSAFADNSLLNIFNFPLRSGNRLHNLEEPNTAVITGTAAKRLFGNLNATGQIVSFEKLGDFKVTAVIEDSSFLSHIDFEAYLSFNTVFVLEKAGILSQNSDLWNGWFNGYTYVRMANKQTTASLDFALQRISADLKAVSKLNGREDLRFEAQRFNKIILGEELNNSIGNVGSKGKTAAELLIGFVILLSACFNYTNLSIARSLKRGREVGVRKIAGAMRWQVFAQFVVESMINAFIAFVLSYFILGLLIEHATFIAGGIPHDMILRDPVLFGWSILFALLTGLLAGILPAWALSSFRPVEVLKNLTQVKLFGGIGLRKSLIVSQFVLALTITIFAGVFSRQFEHMATADPGYNRDNIYALQMQFTNASFLKQRLLAVNGVDQISMISKTFGRGASGKTKMKSEAAKDAVTVDHFDADSAFNNVNRLKLLAGTGFTHESVTDETEVLINENLSKLLSFTTPSEAVGKTFILDDSVSVHVAGVLKDFHYTGMEFPVWPLVIRNRSSQLSVMQVRTGTRSSAIEDAALNQWKAINPDVPFEGWWLKSRLYEQQSAGDMSSGLAFLAFMTIVIAVLGLLGMVVYLTQTREKEMSIRKIIGAGVSDIAMLLSKGFMKMVFIAGLIAVPLSYIASYFFLNMFATRISPGFDIMAGSVFAMMLITLAVILSQVYRVATANPVESLRSE